MKLLASIFVLFVSMSASADNVVVINKENKTELSLSDIKKIFLGRKSSFSNGDRIRPVTLIEGNEVRKVFNQSFLNKSEAQYTGYWAKMSFTGRAVPPAEFANSEAVKEYVSKNGNAIGVMDEQSVDDSVKVVFKF